MSRSLIRLLALSALLGVFLAGCVTAPPVEIIKEAPPVKTPTPPVQRWLRWQESVSTMSPSQLTTALEGAADPGNANQLFYYGLLNQQSDAYDGWVAARDIFRQLNQNEALTTPQRQLAGPAGAVQPEPDQLVPQPGRTAAGIRGAANPGDRIAGAEHPAGTENPGDY